MRPRIPPAVRCFLLALLGAVLASGADAEPRALTVDDILRLHAAGVSEDIIISEIVVTDTVFRLEVDEILRLQAAGVSERLLQFMVDTGRPVLASEAGDEEAAATEVVEVEAEPEAEVEEEEDEEDGGASRVLVSLRWGYPVWWYDVYWWDYWYYDCSYDPWHVSWIYPCHVWYPTWYWRPACWAPPSWGYRHDWWSSRGGSWDPWHGWRDGFAYDWGGSASRPLSERKYKTGNASGKVLLAGVGLRTPDGTRLPEGKPAVRRPARLAIDDRPAGDVRRPVRAVGGKAPVDLDRRTGVRRPAAAATDPTDRPDVRRPARPVRKPAVADRPVKKVVRRVEAAPEQPRAAERPRSGAPEKPEPGVVTKPKVERSSPEPAPAPPKVQSRPTEKSAPAPKAPSTVRPAPAPPGKSTQPAPRTGGGRSSSPGKQRAR
jgi:hypothetical protein